MRKTELLDKYARDGDSRLLLARVLDEETWQQGEECPLCALEVETPPGAGLTHRDYLGSLMGLGLTREKLGDILLSQQGAQVVVLREVLPILLSQWEKVGRYPVRLTPIPLAQLRPVPGERKQIRATVASPGWTLWRRRGSPFPGAGPPS